MSSPDQATPSELGARFFAAAEDVPTFESEQMLAQLGERMFGIQAEPLKLGRYSVLRRLGAGGMGVVYLVYLGYLGYDGELDRKVALKLLRSGPTTNEMRSRVGDGSLVHPDGSMQTLLDQLERGLLAR